ncbi:STL1 [Brettanomyces bruxellensis]|uniref:DEBR0S2_13630g1_1 n=1 Tax=Dekkera bruxellensis TaxID=5007 RepID=A0A7D9CWS4_DEKBR|nr:STL1 [Brettanomyces bruxellensis]
MAQNEEMRPDTGSMQNRSNKTSLDAGDSIPMYNKGSSSSRSNSELTLDVSQFKDHRWKLRSRHCCWGLEGRNLRMAITFVSVVGFSLFGYDQGLMSGIITASQFEETFTAVKGTDRHATVIQGAVTSCYELGCFFGALTSLWIGEKYGRRPMVITGASVLIVGTIISIFPFRNHWALGHFVISRVVTGVGNGFNTATIPIYQSELSKPETRGRLVNLEGSVIAVGTFIAYWVDFGLSYASGSVAWRLPIALQILFALVLLVGMIGLPESPRWLISKGKINEAAYVLSRNEGIDYNCDDIVAEITAIRDAVNRFDNRQLSFNEIWNSGKHQYFKRMVVGASGQFFQQFTGCNAAIYYSTVLFQNTIGLSRRMSLILGGVFATVYALFTILSFFMIDRFGRRPLFFTGAIGQGVAFVISFACLIPDTKASAKGASFGLFLFIAFFAFTILPLPWVYPPEINSLRMRTFATSVSTCTNWICNFAVVMFTPIFINQTRWGCYLFFALVNFLYVPIIYFFYPETAGRSLEEIDIIYAKAYTEHKSVVGVAKTMPRLTFAEVEEAGKSLGIHDIDFKAETEFEENVGDGKSLAGKRTAIHKEIV